MASRARLLHEKQIGLTIARLRGIREAIADLIVFSDDDSLLDANSSGRGVAHFPGIFLQILHQAGGFEI